MLMGTISGGMIRKGGKTVLTHWNMGPYPVSLSLNGQIPRNHAVLLELFTNTAWHLIRARADSSQTQIGHYTLKKLDRTDADDLISLLTQQRMVFDLDNTL